MFPMAEHGPIHSIMAIKGMQWMVGVIHDQVHDFHQHI
jgi:hypothetical protein